MKTPILALALLFVAGGALSAQRVRDVPRRPALWASADTNSARAYYAHGLQNLETSPADAAAAFYWAGRLQPGWADALAGRRAALLLTDKRRLVRYVGWDRNTLRNAEIRAIDSLQLRARMLDPFLGNQFDRHLFQGYMREAMNQYVEAVTGARNEAASNYLYQQWLGELSPYQKAWMNYTEGKYPLALEEYERALRRARRDDKPYYRLDVARIHYLSGSLDQALASFTAAGEEMKALDERDLVRVYESKALVEHTIGAIHEKKSDLDAAREAYGRALQEDLAYYPAHLRLATLALAAGDTATAVSEWDLAVQIAPNEGALRHDHGVFLIKLGKVEEGLAEVRKAIELEPFFAAPYLIIGRVYDQSGMPDEALEHYRAFLARAARDDQYRPGVQARVTAIAAEAAAAAQPAAPASGTTPGSAPR